MQTQNSSTFWNKLKAWAQALEYSSFDYQQDQLIGLRSEVAELSGRVDIVERMTAQHISGQVEKRRSAMPAKVPHVGPALRCARRKSL